MEKSVLKREAEKIVEDLQLLKLLRRYGKAEIVGSVATDLIVKKDIDIHLLLPDQKDLLQTINEISNILLNKPNIDEVRISDWREIESMKVGVDDFDDPSGSWDLEVWVTHRSEHTGFDLVERLKKELTLQKRKIIMYLKEHYFKKGLLKNGMSKKIYRAVMDENVANIEQFEALQNR